MGLLKLEAVAEGQLVITQETKYIELELKEIGVPLRLFKWEGASLQFSNKRACFDQYQVCY